MSSCAPTGLCRWCIPVRGSVGLNLRRIPRPCCQLITGARTSKRISLDPASNTYIGYGFPGSSSNRTVEEATGGMTNTVEQQELRGATVDLAVFVSQAQSVFASAWPASGRPHSPLVHGFALYTAVAAVCPMFSDFVTAPLSLRTVRETVRTYTGFSR